jgi:tetratricopeptide (TPR) repeat protein
MAEQHHTLADAAWLHERGRLEEAAPIYSAVLERDGGNPSALYLSGVLGLQRGDSSRALDLLGRANRIRPNHPGTQAALAAARLAQGAPQAAIEAADDVLVGNPGHATALFVRGSALSQLRRPEEAARDLRASLAGNPTHADAQLNLGNALVDLDDLVGAERHCRAAIALDPTLAAAHASLGHVLTLTGRLAEACAACDEAIRLRPDFAEAHWNQGIACLLAGDYARGWDRYEWRKRHPVYGRDFRHPPAAEWRGESLLGRRLLVTAEQGFGDAIQFARYLPALVAAGAQVTLACAAPLIPLLSQMAPCVALAPSGSVAWPNCDFWVDQMSLPRRCGTRPEAVPGSAGYLQADPDRVAAWQALLPRGRRIGLVWAGNPAHSNDRKRSLPPSLLDRLRPPPGASFVGLQIGPRAGEVARLTNAVDIAGLLTDFAETAAVVACLDLVITIDSAVAHLAGALGVATWLMLPHAPDWRWMLERGDTPWYQFMRLLRQKQPGDWDGVIDQVAAGLAALGSNATTGA